MSALDTSKPVAGDHGLIVPFLRQAWALRNSPRPKFRAEMRADVRKCLRLLRSNREVQS